jgi:TPR repeat protein
MELAIERGSTEAVFILGTWYERGNRGIQADTERARQLFSKGVAAQHPGCYLAAQRLQT